MGSFQSAVQQPQTSGGKGAPPQPFQQTRDSTPNLNSNLNTQDIAPLGPQPQILPGPQPQIGQAKGASGQRFTYSPTSGQPQMGRPNQYTNTVGQWDNASVMPQPTQRSGKGKGG